MLAMFCDGVKSRAAGDEAHCLSRMREAYLLPAREPVGCMVSRPYMRSSKLVGRTALHRERYVNDRCSFAIWGYESMERTTYKTSFGVAGSQKEWFGARRKAYCGGRVGRLLIQLPVDRSTTNVMLNLSLEDSLAS
jgi:hypothetical protein